MCVLLPCRPAAAKCQPNGPSKGAGLVLLLLLFVVVVVATALPGWKGVMVNSAKSAHSQHETAPVHVKGGDGDGCVCPSCVFKGGTIVCQLDDLWSSYGAARGIKSSE